MSNYSNSKFSLSADGVVASVEFVDEVVNFSVADKDHILELDISEYDAELFAFFILERRLKDEQFRMKTHQENIDRIRSLNNIERLRNLTTDIKKINNDDS